jgi:hypothetical protein
MNMIRLLICCGELMVKIKKGEYYNYKDSHRLLIVEKVCRKFDIVVLAVVSDTKLKTYISKQQLKQHMIKNKVAGLLYG